MKYAYGDPIGPIRTLATLMVTPNALRPYGNPTPNIKKIPKNCTI